MNTDILVASQFRRYMNSPWSDIKEPKCVFESLVISLRRQIEAGEPFTTLNDQYRPFLVAECGYRVNEYCKNDTQIIETLVKEELQKRGLLESILTENHSSKVLEPGNYVSHDGKKFSLVEPLSPFGTFLDYPMYRHKDMVFTAEGLQKEDGAVAVTPTNNVGSGNIAGVSPGQEPPGRRGKFFKRNILNTKELKKKIKKRTKE